MKIKNIKNNTVQFQSSSGFALIISIVVTSMLLLVSFVVTNIALKQLVLAYSGQESQYSFYNADSGVECAEYWDVRNGIQSAFATSTPGVINCNNQTVTTGSQSVPTIPSQPSLVGGGDSNPVSIFKIDYSHGCAIVRVTKLVNGDTTIESRGYNTCDTSSDRRFERGIIVTY